VVLDAVIDSDEHVYPMVPAGRGLHEMVLHPRQQLDINDTTLTQE
jgi:hypothetical protein